MHIELAIPICHHGLMVVGPAVLVLMVQIITAVGTHGLYVMDSHHR